MADEDNNQPPVPEDKADPAPEANGTTADDDGADASNKPPSKPASRQGSAQGSRPPSARSKGSRSGSQISEVQGSRPPSAGKPESRPSSAINRPASAAKAGSRPASATKSGSRPASARSRPTSAVSASKVEPSSQAIEGSRPASAKPEGEGSRPGSMKAGSPAGSQAGSQAGSRAGSQAGSRAGSQTGSRAGSQAGSRVGSRPVSAKFTELDVKPESPSAGRPGSQPAAGDPADDNENALGGENEIEWNLEPKEKQGSEKDEEEDDVPEIPLNRMKSLNRGIKRTSSIMNVSQMDLSDGMKGSSPLHEILEETDSLDLTASGMEVGNDRWGLDFHADRNRSIGGGGGGDDDDDPDDDEEGDGDFEGDEEEMDSDNSDGETDMVVLDPDHPLMKRFQTALSNHLNKQNEKITLELRNLEESLRVKGKEREDLGVELYGVQQELARYQMILEKKHDDVAATKKDRQTEEQELGDVRNLYKDLQSIVNKEQKKESELRSELENLALRLFYMDNAKEDVRSDIAVMRRAAEKVESEVSKAEMEKQKQDLYVDRLVEKVDKLKEEIAMYEAQISAQSEETKVARESLYEAYMEIETINLEKKDLYQKWCSSLIGMRRRDEAHSATQEALSQQEQNILSLVTEIEGYKKSIQKEQEQNEKLTLILSKTEKEIELARKHLNQIQAKHDALKAEYTTYTRMLHETEQALARATADKTLKETEKSSLMKQIEQEAATKMKLEDDIVERMQTQLTLDKAGRYSRKLTKKIRDRTKNVENETADVENQIANAALDTVNIRTRVQRLKKVLAELDDQIADQNKIITKSEQEIVKRNAIIERKQNQVDIMNKKLNQMIAAAGGVELGPLEIQINSLQKSIEALNQEVIELQQLWLRQQSELVRLSQNKEKETQELVACKRQLTILSQKKIRTENDIDQQHREMCDIERNVRNMRNDILKLNTLLHKEKNMGDNLEQGNALMENDFISGLKEAEMESIELQGSLDGIKEEKERLLNSLVEAERQIMLWEKKTQLARETRAAVDSEVGQGEMRAMRSEIHRMQVRYSQLMKQQEKMIQDMEKAVSRRDTILTRGDAQSKMKKKVLTKGTFERQLAELRKKIKQTINDANGCDNEIRDLREHQQALSQQLEEKQMNCQQLESTSDTLDGDLEQVMEVKQKNLSDLLGRQQKMKYYQQVKDGKYIMICRTPSALEMETKKQEDRLQALTTIVDRLNDEFPRAQPALRKVTMSLRARAAPVHDEPSLA